MKIKSLIMFTVLLLTNSVTAQDFKIGKVTIAELEEKQHPKDPSAPAAILFNTGIVKFDYSQDNGFQVSTEVKARIKIYKKEGFEWATKMVTYYTAGSSPESVMFDDAATYNLVNGKIEKTKLTKDGAFNEKINRYISRKKITLPNVKEGSVIEFVYTIRSDARSSLKDWTFQYSIPVNFSEFKTYIPEYFTFKPTQKGTFPVAIVKETQNATFNLIFRDRSDNKITTSTVEYEKVDYIEYRNYYTAKDVPAMKEEAYVNNIDNYTSSISNELSYELFPRSTIKYYSTDWESVAKKIYEYDDFGNELQKTDYFENDLKQILADKTTDVEKIATIFNFVKSKVKWNTMKGFSTDDGVKKAYQEGTGNVAEINLMLTAMLKHAGLQANPVLISTRDNGIALFPSINAFNYVIAAVDLPEGRILLDATEKYSLPNILPDRDLNWMGRLIKKDGTSEMVDLMPTNVSRRIDNTNLIVNSDGTINGKIRTQYSDYEALDFRKKYVAVNKDVYLEKLENKSNNIEISNYARENDLEIGQPIVEIYDFKSSKEVENINGKLYFSPLLFLATTENPFKQEVREYPIDFVYPFERKFNVNISIPEGYTVETLPKNINIATGDNIGAFKYFIQATEGKIQIVVTATIYAPIVSSDYYDIIKDFYKQMIEKETEKIVLKKK